MKAPLALLLAAAVVLTAADYDAEGASWWNHVLYLADDKLEGRDTGSPGHRKAAEYVAAAFERAGLKAAGTQGYFQPVSLNSRTIDESKCSLTLLHGGLAQTLTLGDDANLGVRGDPLSRVEAEAVFVGYGLRSPEVKHDDLTGLDLQGKVAVYFSGAPKNVPGPLAAHMAVERWKQLHQAGAIGAATMPDPKHNDVPWTRATLARFNPTVTFKDPALNDTTQGLQFSAYINPENADKWFAGTGHTLKEIIALADAGKPLPRFPLKVKVAATVAYKSASIVSDNVVAILPGSDPKLKDEYVVVSAHLDHVGVGQPINGDKIYNGAMDNASGTASLIELARLFTAKPDRPRRSILFVAVTGEEKGLLGSKFFAGHPTVKSANIVGNINVDMFLPLFPLQALTVYGLDESDLGEMCRTVGSEQGIRIVGDRAPERNLFVRSDQYNFVRQGVPALFFHFDAEPGTPEFKTLTEWIRVRYHAPSDDTAQPVDKPAAARFDRYVMALAERVANRDQRPQWKGSSFFKRFAHSD